MSHNATAMDLLKDGVPLALLFDLAGLGASSEELYRTETSWFPAEAVLTASSLDEVA